MAKFGEGDAGKDLLWIVGIVLVLGIIWIILGGPASFKSDTKPGQFTNPPNLSPTTSKISAINSEQKSPIKSAIITTKTSNEKTNSADSLYKGMVSISLGQSYRLSSLPDKEYVILRSSIGNKQKINITGWKISNGYSGRYMDSSGQLIQGRSTIVTIPYGTLLLSCKSLNPLGPILLNPGDVAYVITGSVVGSRPYKISSSFKVNKCSGYLEKYDGYEFTPHLSINCPPYDEELDVSRLSDKCESYVHRYGRTCVTPEITYDDKNGGILIDGLKMTSSCRNLFVSTFNYDSCFERHKSDSDFLGKKWYIFLNYRAGGLYAKTRATLTLYDSLGKVVDTYSY
jgi:hypothetical protein